MEKKDPPQRIYTDAQVLERLEQQLKVQIQDREREMLLLKGQRDQLAATLSNLQQMREATR